MVWTYELDEQLELEVGEGYLYPFQKYSRCSQNVTVGSHLGRIIHPLGQADNPPPTGEFRYSGKNPVSLREQNTSPSEDNSWGGYFEISALGYFEISGSVSRHCAEGQTLSEDMS